MWISNIFEGKYIKSVFTFTDGSGEGGLEITTERDDAKRFSSKQEAKDFMAKYSITGSIIPA